MTPHEVVTLFTNKTEEMTEQNPVAVWIRHCCEVDPRALERLPDLYASFCAFYRGRKGGIYYYVAVGLFPTQVSLTRALRRLSKEGTGIDLSFYRSKTIWDRKRDRSQRMIQGLRLLW